MNNFRINAVFLFSITFGLSLILELILPLPAQKCTSFISGILGSAVLLTALGINYMAYRSFLSHQTSYYPQESPRVLITSGIFSFSRNPVYLALVLSHSGIGIIVCSFWIISGSFVLGIVIDRSIIRREESLLTVLFPKEFATYRKKTRRWI